MRPIFAGSEEIGLKWDNLNQLLQWYYNVSITLM